VCAPRVPAPVPWLLRACTAIAVQEQSRETFSKYADFTASAANKCGVGIAFSVDSPQGGALVVKGFVPTGPAAADGRIRKGDVLVAVDGLDVRTLHTGQVSPLIYGKRGSAVVLGLVRALPGCSTTARAHSCLLTARLATFAPSSSSSSSSFSLSLSPLLRPS
jgi:C-terminal processing protease CtpA/Prc